MWELIAQSLLTLSQVEKDRSLNAKCWDDHQKAAGAAFKLDELTTQDFKDFVVKAAREQGGEQLYER